jgi:hypothetical protein
MVTRRFDPGVPALGARWDLAQTLFNNLAQGRKN